MKFTAKDREQLAEMKQGWLIFIVLAALVFSPVLIEDWFGHGWRLISAAIAIPIWFIIRPWRFGLLSEKSHRDIRHVGSVIICFIPIVEAIRYYVWP